MVKGKEANGNKVIKHIEKRTLEILKFFFIGGGCGIRTHVGVNPNGFQDFCNVSVLPNFQGI